MERYLEREVNLMNKRQRKKWLKQHGKYVGNSELWNLDVTICEWILPRLKQFKKINIAYPGTPEIPTPEAWDEVLDKMIKAFELAQYDPIDLDENLNPRDDYDYNHEKYKKISEEYEKIVKEGLHLFAENFWHLWI